MDLSSKWREQSEFWLRDKAEENSSAPLIGKLYIHKSIVY